jgi:hypothetical protein
VLGGFYVIWPKASGVSPLLVVHHKISHLNRELLNQIWLGRPLSKLGLLLKIEISSLVHFYFITGQNKPKFYLQLHGNE